MPAKKPRKPAPARKPRASTSAKTREAMAARGREKASIERRRKLMEMVKDPRFISGIYNYCDRWCERCTMTRRCLTHEGYPEHRHDPELQDMNNKKFWDHMGDIFADTFAMIAEKCEEMGIDIDAEEPEEDRKKREDEEKRVDRHPVVRAGHKYRKMADEWFKAHRPDFDQKERDTATAASIGTADAETYRDMARMSDALEVISWYMFFITAKSIRALRRDPEDNWWDDPIQNDSNGSAKIALIGIDRSIAAWGVLHAQMPDLEDSILDILAHLDRLRKALEKAKPDARKFIRPGFDAEPPEQKKK